MSQEPPPGTAPLLRRRLPRLAAALLIVAAIGTIYVFKIERRMSDYDVYKRAAERALVAAPLYRPDDGHYQFKYLPAFAVATVPLALGPARLVRACWFAASLCCSSCSCACVSVLPERLRSRGFLLGITFVCWEVFVHELERRQVNILLALVVGAVRQLRLGAS